MKDGKTLETIPTTHQHSLIGGEGDDPLEYLKVNVTFNQYKSVAEKKKIVAHELDFAKNELLNYLDSKDDAGGE
jgi:hypothetical protein